MRGFLDRDFLQTNENFFFCVVGSIHPPKRVISYVKYIPSHSGIWRSKNRKFRRILKKYTIPDLLKTFNFLKNNYPEYLFESPADNITLTAVPLNKIKNHFMPEKKLAQIRQKLDLDKLQQKLIKFIKFLENISDILEKFFGVTGSLLLDIHHPKFSDLDITVYGLENSWILRRALTKKSTYNSQIRRLKGKSLKNWCINKTMKHPLTIKDASKIYERKWNLGLFEDTWFSIHPVRVKKEKNGKYGERTYIPQEQVVMQAIVKDDIDSIFLPSVYKVEEVKILDGPQIENITEVVSYESLYESIANNGESIIVRGKLEKKIGKGLAKDDFRVIVGSIEGKGEEFIKLLN